MPPQIDFSKYGLAQPTPTAGKIDFSKYGLNQPSIPKVPAISTSRKADLETAQKYGATFTPSTENQSPTGGFKNTQQHSKLGFQFCQGFNRPYESNQHIWQS